MLLQPIRNFVQLSEYSHKIIKKCCGGDRVIDALLHFPTGICKRSGDIKNFTKGEKLTAVIKIVDHVAPHYKNRPYKIIGQTFAGDIVTVIYFNYRVPYLQKLFPMDKTIAVSGNAVREYDEVKIIHPDIITTPDRAKNNIGVEPIYSLVGNLTNKTLQYVINSCLKIVPKNLDWLPDDIRTKYGLPTFSEAIITIHRPKKESDLLVSNIFRKRIAVDELLANQVRLKQMKRNLQGEKVPVFRENGTILNRLKLPFDLTEDQIQCLEEIKSDLLSGRPMNRLLQGDVGSGKTVVAFIAMLIALENGLQTALLAPAEILAWQHFETIQRLSENLNLEIDIMLSSNRRARKRQIKELLDGTTQILIGTHAIFEENVEFKNLGLVVIDEQHKFGVMQRLRLIDKSKYPNILSMSATPIPRTLLMGCYGNIDVSTIKNKPKGRQSTETLVISEEKIDGLVEGLKKIDSQIYWVCPVIEESESLTDVNTRCDYLKKSFSAGEVEVLHGKMKPFEKDRMMTRFKNNEFKLLVSTTVIEVGVDIPNANVMVIEHAERFGLAQLHQLRGRVGRGNQQSYCVLLYHFPISDVGKKRLQLMKESTDGFFLSEEDLKLRGAGDILGKEQSGFKLLRFSDFSDNYSLVEMADAISSTIDIDSSEVSYLCNIFNRILNDNIS